MEFEQLVPDFQPIPFPGPLWLLKLLLIAGFYGHALPMNVALMGGLVAGVFILTGQQKEHAYALRLGNTLAFSLPFFVSFAITMGIVPLLFLQLVYGPLFYTSSVIMAVPWLLVIFLLLSGYYGYYVFGYQRQRLAGRGPWFLLAIGVVFMAIAFMFSNNMTLMLTPDRWFGLYHHSPSGLNLNWEEPQLIPRYVHFIVAAVAVTGLTIGTFGLYWHPREREYGKWLISTGAAIFLLATLLQFPVGIWFMLSLPHDIMMNFLGREFWGTGLLTMSMVLDVLALGTMVLAMRNGSPRPFQIGMAASLIVIFLMVGMRHMLRVYYTQGFFQPEAMAVETQLIPLVAFLLGLLVLVGYLIWLLKITWQAFHLPRSL